MSDPFLTALSALNNRPTGAAAAPAGDLMGGNLGQLLAHPQFQQSSVDERRDLFGKWKETALPRIAAEQGYDAKTQKRLARQADADAKTHLRSDGVFSTISKNFMSGVEDAGVGLGVLRGASADSVSRDLLDTTKYQGDADAQKYQRKSAGLAKTTDDAKGFWNTAGAMVDQFGNILSNPKQSAGQVARSMGASLPLGLASGAAGATIGALPGAIIGYLAGSAGSNITLEMGAALKDALAQYYPTFDMNDASLSNQKSLEHILATDPEILSQARTKGGIKGGTIAAVEGAVDALTFGVGGQLTKPLTKTLIKNAAGQTVVETGASKLVGAAKATGKVGLQGLSEGGGEYIGTTATGDKPSLGEAFNEGILGMAPGVVDVAVIDRLRKDPAATVPPSAPGAPPVAPTTPTVPGAPVVPTVSAATPPTGPVDPAITALQEGTTAATVARAEEKRAHEALVFDPNADATRAQKDAEETAAIEAMVQADTAAKAKQDAEETAAIQRMLEEDQRADADKRTAMLDGRLADDRQATLDDQASLAGQHLDRLVGDVASLDLMSPEAAGARFDLDYEAWAAANPNAARQVTPAVKARRREDALRLTGYVNDLVQALPEGDLLLWRKEQEEIASRVVRDRSAAETSQTFDSLIPERKEPPSVPKGKTPRAPNTKRNPPSAPPVAPTNGGKVDTSEKRVQETPKNEQVAPTEVTPQGQTNEQTTTQNTASQTSSEPAATGPASAEKGTGDAGPAGAKGGRTGRRKSSEAAPTGRTGQDAAQPGAGSAETAVREGGSGTGKSPDQQSGDGAVSDTPAASGSTGERGAANQAAAAGSGNSGEQGSAGQSTGRVSAPESQGNSGQSAGAVAPEQQGSSGQSAGAVAPEQQGSVGKGSGAVSTPAKRWEAMAWRDGEPVAFSTLSEKARDAWVTATEIGEATMDLVRELMKSVRADPEKESQSDKDISRPISAADREAAQTEWDENAGYAADQYYGLNANDQVPFDALNQDSQDEWIIAHRDGSLDGGQLDNVAQRILRSHARNESTTRANKRAKAAEKAALKPIGRVKGAPSAQDRVGENETDTPPAPAGRDAATASGVPASPGAGGVQADGVILYRGVPAGSAERETVGGALFMSPDRAVAEMYAGKGGAVSEQVRSFKKLLQAPNWMEAKKALGLPRSATMEDLVNAAREAGHDGVTFVTKNKREYIAIDSAPAAPKGTAVEQDRVGENETDTLDRPDQAVVAEQVGAQLEPEEIEALEKYYKAKRDSNKFAAAVYKDVVSLVNRGANAVAAVIRGTIQKVANGVLAVAVLFNGAAPIPPFNFDLPKIEQSVRNVRAEVPENAKAMMSELAQGVYSKLAPIAAKTGKGFIVADKPNGKVHMFFADGSLLVQDTTLYGKDAGDALGKVSSLEGGPKITPAGPFTMALADSEYAGGKALNLVESRDATGYVALHAAWLGDPSERRAERLKSNKIEDKKISYGCINTGHKTFLTKLLPHIDKFDGGIIAVLPDDKAATEGMFKGTTETTTSTTDKFARGVDNTRTNTGREEKGPTREAPAETLTSTRYRNEPGTAPTSTISDATLRSTVTAVENALGGDTGVGILDSVTDIDRSQTAGTRAGALINGQVYLFRDGIPSGIEGLKTIFHELFHKGLRNLLPDAEYGAMLNKLYNQSAEIRKLADAYLNDPANAKDIAEQPALEDKRALAVDEALAVVAESNDLLSPSLARKVADFLAAVADKMGLAPVAQWLRTAGTTPLQNFIKDALKASVHGAYDPQAPAWLQGQTGDSPFVDLADSVARAQSEQVSRASKAELNRWTAKFIPPDPGTRYRNTPPPTTNTQDLTKLDAFSTFRGEAEQKKRSNLSKVIEMFVNSYEPVRAALNQAKDSPLMLALQSATTRADGLMAPHAKAFREYVQALGVQAKAMNIPLETLRSHVDQYALSAYVASGANKEVADRAQARMDEIDTLGAQIAKDFLAAEAKQAAGKPLTKEEAKALDTPSLSKELSKEYAELQEWLAKFDEFDGQVLDRKAKQDAGYQAVGGLSTAEAQQAKEQIEDAYGPNIDRVRALHQQLLEMQRTTTNDAVARGLYSDAQIEGWTDNALYVPTTGTPDAQAVGANLDALGASLNSQAIHKRRSGRVSLSEPVSDAVLRRMHGVFTELGYRDFKEELAKLAGTTDPDGKWVPNPDSGVHLVPAAQAASMSPKGSRTVSYRVQEKDPVTGKTSTKQMAFYFDDPTAGAAINGGHERHAAQALGGVLASPLRWAQWWITQGSLVFPILNSFRDIGEKMVNLSTARDLKDAKGDPVKMGTWASLASGYARFMTGAAGGRVSRATFGYEFNGTFANTPEGRALKELIEAGGVSTWANAVGRSRDDIVKLIKQQSGASKMTAAAKETLAKWSGGWEMQTSLVTFMMLKEKGMTTKDAAAVVLDTMNFRKQGTVTPALRSLFMFINPAIQGAYNSWNSLVKDGKPNAKGIGYLVTAVAVSMMLQEMAGAGSDDEDEDSELMGPKSDRHTLAEKGRSFIVYAGDQPVKIPVPFGITGLAWTAATISREFQAGKLSATDAAAEMARTLTRELTGAPSSPVVDNPVLWLLRTLTPSPLQGVVSAATDTNEFGTPLSKRGLSSDMNQSQQGKEQTPQIWKDWAQTADGLWDMTPEKWRALAGIVLVGPLKEMADAATDDNYRSNGVFAATGMNRVLGKTPKALESTYYRRLDEAHEAMRVFNEETDDDRPRDENGRRERESEDEFLERLDDSSLNEEQRALVLAYRRIGSGRKKADETAMRDFIEETQP